MGDEIHLPISTDGLGRIAAQNAKQVLYQRVREAERENIYNEYIDRVGEILNGTVKRFERGDVIVDLGRTEAVVPRSEQARHERYSQGERIRAVIVDVHKQPKGPQIVLSRTDPRLLVKLFETEVPEIYDGTVVIKNAVRAPGERAKVAVYSRERDVDPVGACVGMKGSRVQSIIRELRGEKIDIIEYSDDLVTFAQSALAPAKITRVSVTHQGEVPHLDVIVEDEQLSLAIGKRGQNVRLASELIGSRIDIKSESDVKDEVADALARMLQTAMAQTPAPRRAPARRWTSPPPRGSTPRRSASSRRRASATSTRWPTPSRRRCSALGVEDFDQRAGRGADRLGEGSSGSSGWRISTSVPSAPPRRPRRPLRWATRTSWRPSAAPSPRASSSAPAWPRCSTGERGSGRGGRRSAPDETTSRERLSDGAAGAERAVRPGQFPA